MALSPEKLKELREAVGVTQRALAIALDVSQAYVSVIESGEKKGPEFIERAERYLREKFSPVRISESVALRSKRNEQNEPRISSSHAGAIAWAWTGLSSERESGDVFDFSKIDSTTYAFLLTDVVGAGVRASWQSAQIRFGFHAIASGLTRYSNTPLRFLGPLATALNAVRIRRLAPPSLAVACLSSRTASFEIAAFGLPNPLVFRKRTKRLEPLEINSADWFLQSEISSKFVSRLDLGPGDSVFLFTDGFLGWLKEKKGLDSSGAARLFTEAADFHAGKATVMIRAVLSASSPQARKPNLERSALDDATLFVISRSQDGMGR